ncbi:class I adenylate-forming enzyme family protein [Nonomuraea turcica]|uniref:class I adenylate-forming enzyme family protein n=1 Tax=Nonomuraea sp. G32 TaxID=3067274 RepID=UPI00273B9CC5|nr:AMP-binding protein [Nonomuraea sp. G32]MDP4502540.1 AMP-binding protein [Nonomuraea sp. G32]
MNTQLSVDLTTHHDKVLTLTIPESLDLAALTWPAKGALHFVDSGQRMTWAELHDAVGRIRSALEARGLRPGDKVGLMLRNQVEFPLAWLAVIEAGAVAVPLNPKYTRREVDFVLGDSGASWLVAAEDLRPLAAGAVPEERLIMTGPQFEELLSQPATPRTHRAGRLDLVGIQFTSGTTGLPKGCLLTHEYWLELGVYGAALFDDPQELLADHPFYYMQNQAYFMMVLASGGRLHVTPGLSRRKFMGWLVDHDIDFAWIDEGLLDEPPSDLDRRLKLKKAPVMAFTPSLHRPLEERFGLMARDWYASTETGSGTFVPWHRTDLVGSNSMGWCLPDRESKVIDATGAEVPPGEPGEFCLRGPGMMLGYHNRPEVNAELFLPGGWFRTGDIVRKTADGEHFYVGRIKDMIRRSGENISAAEVEQHISALPGVLEVSAIPVPDPRRDEEVKAIIVLKPGSTVTVAEILAWCRQGLARFKIPRYLEFRDTLPYTPSGKVAKAELKAEDPFAGKVVDTEELV